MASACANASQLALDKTQAHANIAASSAHESALLSISGFFEPQRPSVMIGPNYEISTIADQRHGQMLRLVAKGFYRELINYGVNEAEVLTVAAHLLDNVLNKAWSRNDQADYYNRLFSLKDVEDNWAKAKRLGIQQVSVLPLDLRLVPQIAAWLRVPAIRDSFYPRFPAIRRTIEPLFCGRKPRLF